MKSQQFWTILLVEQFCNFYLLFIVNVDVYFYSINFMFRTCNCLILTSLFIPYMVDELVKIFWNWSNFIIKNLDYNTLLGSILVITSIRVQYICIVMWTYRVFGDVLSIAIKKKISLTCFSCLQLCWLLYDTYIHMGKTNPHVEVIVD